MLSSDFASTDFHQGASNSTIAGVCQYCVAIRYNHGVTIQLGGLVVKSFACCAGGPGFDPRVGNPKFSNGLHQQNLSKPVNRM